MLVGENVLRIRPGVRLFITKSGETAVCSGCFLLDGSHIVEEARGEEDAEGLKVAKEEKTCGVQEGCQRDLSQEPL